MYFLIDQHGCAKNTVDAEVIARRLTDAGHTLVMDETQAVRLCGEDGEGLVVIINSCGFIESAKTESIAAVMTARQRFPRAKVLLAGCLAERYHTDLAQSLTEADGIFGNGDLSRVADVVAAMERGERPVAVSEQRGVCTARRNVLFTRPGTAYVKLTEGCNNRCAFCAIPIIRGELRCRPVADVIAEIAQLVSSGIYEVNLIGQDVASYEGLLELLNGIASIKVRSLSDENALAFPLYRNDYDGHFIVRLLYMHPDKLMSNDLWRGIVQAMQKDSRLLPYFDIPFQSGSDRIIRAMGRTGSAAEYQALVEGIRAALPMAAIRTTFMAGFPGETDEDAADTVRFLQAIKPDWSGCFTYSREEGTAAYSMKGRVGKRTAKERMERIAAAQEAVTQNALQSRLGQEYDTIIEEIIPKGDDTPAMAIGRAWFQAPEVDGAFVVELPDDKQAAPGSVVRVHADNVSGVDIVGHLSGSSSASHPVVECRRRRCIDDGQRPSQATTSAGHIV